jgi:hypothetical protein
VASSALVEKTFAPIFFLKIDGIMMLRKPQYTKFFLKKQVDANPPTLLDMGVCGPIGF